MATRILACVLTLCLLGCTTTRAVERMEHTTLSALKPGDHVIVEMVSDDTQELTVRSAGNDTLRGIAPDGRLWEIPMRLITSVQRAEMDHERELDPGKTLGLGLLSYVTLMIVGGMVLSKAIKDAIDDHNNADATP